MSITESQRLVSPVVDVTQTSGNAPADFAGYANIFGPQLNVSGMRNMYSQKIPAGSGALARRGIANILAGQFNAVQVVPFKRRVPSFAGPPAGTR